MCNPRRVEVTATRQVAAAWEREVRRTVARSALVTGEARVRQALDASVGAPALAALELALDSGVAGWTPTASGGGYRHEVEGGHVLYWPGERVLEIVAHASDTIEAEGQAALRLGGRVEAELSARGEGRYYDDGHGGRTEERARQEAERAAQQALDAELAARTEQAAAEAEAAREAEVLAAAERDVQAQLGARAAARQADLAARAAEHLGAVGARARHVFHRLLGRAYRDALLALVRRRGGAAISVAETGDVIDIEFLLPS